MLFIVHLMVLCALTLFVHWDPYKESERKEVEERERERGRIRESERDLGLM